MSVENRLEALRLASGIGSDPVKIVETADLFINFLNGKPGAVVEKTVAADKPKPVETKVVDSPKTVEQPKIETATETVDVKVARLAKELLNKSRPKLIATLKELGVERARDLKPEQLEEAAKVFEKAVKEAA